MQSVQLSKQAVGVRYYYNGPTEGGMNAKREIGRINLWIKVGDDEPDNLEYM